MKISAKAEYACLAMLALARHRLDDAPVRIREIAEAHDIPERYLVQILLQLKGAGLVHSTRGASGGYRLARSAEAISLGEVLWAVDGPASPPGPPPARPREPWPRSGRTSGRPRSWSWTAPASRTWRRPPARRSGSSDHASSRIRLSGFAVIYRDRG